MARAYRFHDYAALSVSPGTEYLTAKQARKIARALNRIARSIESEKFHLSPSGMGDDVTGLSIENNDLLLRLNRESKRYE